MKKITFILLLLTAFPLFAMRDVREYGARGDGKTTDTAAIQKAIDAGGIVHFPAGTYLTGTIYLKSNGGIDLAPGAVLLASSERKDYNDDKAWIQNQTNYSKSERVSGAHLIVCLEQKNVVIRGEGTICGNQKAFYDAPETVGPEMGWTRLKQKLGWRPSQMVYVCESDNITIKDVTMTDPPYWTCYIFGCRDVRVDNIRITMPFFSRNGDGLSIDSCKNVTIANCSITSGDDALVIRSCDFRLKNPQPLENVTISNCILNTYCYGVRVGVGRAPVRNVKISNIICRARIAVYIRQLFGRERLIENCIFSDWSCDVEQGIRLVNAKLNAPAEEFAVRNITFRNFTGRAALPIELTPGVYTENISIKDCTFNLRRIDRSRCYYPRDPTWRSPVTAAGINGLYLNNIRILWDDPEPCFIREKSISKNCRNVSIVNCDFGKVRQMNK